MKMGQITFVLGILAFAASCSKNGNSDGPTGSNLATISLKGELKVTDYPFKDDEEIKRIMTDKNKVDGKKAPTDDDVKALKADFAKNVKIFASMSCKEQGCSRGFSNVELSKTSKNEHKVSIGFKYLTEFLVKDGNSSIFRNPENDLQPIVESSKGVAVVKVTLSLVPENNVFQGYRGIFNGNLVIESGKEGNVEFEPTISGGKITPSQMDSLLSQMIEDAKKSEAVPETDENLIALKDVQARVHGSVVIELDDAKYYEERRLEAVAAGQKVYEKMLVLTVEALREHKGKFGTNLDIIKKATVEVKYTK